DSLLHRAAGAGADLRDHPTHARAHERGASLPRARRELFPSLRVRLLRADGRGAGPGHARGEAATRRSARGGAPVHGDADRARPLAHAVRGRAARSRRRARAGRARGRLLPARLRARAGRRRGRSGIGEIMRVSFLRIVLLSALAAAASACGQQSDAARAQAPPPPPEVLVAVAERGDALITHEASGRAVAYRPAEVRARVEGILEERLYREGGEVEAGQVLFRIDRRTLEAEVAAAKAALAKARANAEIALQTAQRYRQLIGDQAISKQELDQ